MGELIQPLLIVLLLVSLATLLTTVALWWRTTGLESRVAKLEAYQESSLTHAETRAIYERMASIDGRLNTTTQLLQSVQRHLLEKD